MLEWRRKRRGPLRLRRTRAGAPRSLLLRGGSTELPRCHCEQLDRRRLLARLHYVPPSSLTTPQPSHATATETIAALAAHATALDAAAIAIASAAVTALPAKRSAAAVAAGTALSACAPAAAGDTAAAPLALATTATQAVAAAAVAAQAVASAVAALLRMAFASA